MIDIREACADDAEALAAAHIEGWRVGYRHLLPDDFLDAPEFASERLARWRAWTWRESMPDSVVFAAVWHDRVVGFGHCGAERTQPTCDQSGKGDVVATMSGRGEVYGFYLHPDAWGSGAAAALMARCHEHLRDDGFGQAVLWVLRDNPRARSFYEKAGWTVSGRTMMFEGPQTTAALPTPLPEVEYTITFL